MKKTILILLSALFLSSCDQIALESLGEANASLFNSNSTIIGSTADINSGGFRATSHKIVDNIAYITSVSLGGISAEGFMAFDISDTENIVMIGQFNDGTNYFDLDIVGNTAFLVGPNYVTSVDITDPRNLIELDTLSIPSYSTGITVSGNIAVIGRSNGFEILDITNPSSLSSLSSTSTGTKSYATAISGSILFNAQNSIGVVAYDISDPENITVIGTISVSTDSSLATYESRSLSIQGNLVAFEDGDAGVKLIDVTDLYNPIAVSTILTDAESYSRPVMSGDKLFIGDLDQDGKAIVKYYNISDIYNPVYYKAVDFVTSSAIDSRYATLSIEADTMYLTSERNGFKIIKF